MTTPHPHHPHHSPTRPALPRGVRIGRAAALVAAAFLLAGCTPSQRAYPVAHASTPDFLTQAVDEKYPGATAEHVQTLREAGDPSRRVRGYRGFIMRDDRVIAEFRSSLSSAGHPTSFVTRSRGQ